ncbi:unnamed protein product [Rodentolepis nana]|uniref:Uncharacterized protein n=1 Tax=Rodentolepis nana TaxID=102285 RepID=A0A0R3TAA1_RODNA|nr:unnamed protein product [Rodentolepis nana]
MTASQRYVRTNGNKCPCIGYINPEALEDPDLAKPDPLAELVKSYDRLKKELEQAKFSNVLQDIVCEPANSLTSAVPGQKRQADASNLQHSISTMKLRKTHLRSNFMPLQSFPPLLPPPQTEPVNLSNKSAIEDQPTRALPSITPPSPIGSPISTANMLAQLLILSGMFPHLLKLNPQVRSSPPSSSTSPLTPIGSLFSCYKPIQASFYP